jgi:hypothetical protein
VFFLWDERRRKKEQSIERRYLFILPMEAIATHTFERFSSLTLPVVRADVRSSAHIYILVFLTFYFFFSQKKNKKKKILVLFLL